jgi:hypothetical protein
MYRRALCRILRLEDFFSSWETGNCRFKSSKHSFRCARRFFSSLLWTSRVPALKQNSIISHSSTSITVTTQHTVQLTLASDIPCNHPAGPVVRGRRGPRWRRVGCGRVCWAVGSAVGVAKWQQVGVEGALLQCTTKTHQGQVPPLQAKKTHGWETGA